MPPPAPGGTHHRPAGTRRPLAGWLLLLLLVAVTACSGSSEGAAPAASTQPAAATTTTVDRPPAPPSSAAPTVPGRPTQPPQPTSGPGGSDLPHGDWRASAGGSGADAWYVFEPIDPQPASAPVTVVMHGYYEFKGYDQMYELIRHTVRGGSIVIYPRWQTAVAKPCPGPVDIEPCMRSAVAGIKGALAFLRADPHRVQPDTSRTSYFGFSFGGIITTNLANRYASFGVPEPRAVFLDDPHDGGLTGTDEPAVDDSLAGIPSTTLLVCHVGAQGVISDPKMANASCNAIFPKLTSIPAANKALVMTRPDDHGEPTLVTIHGVCASTPGKADAYDWGFCWKTWDALRAAALDGADRQYALGDTPQQRSNGRWSDGVPVVPLVVQAAAPIHP